MSDIEHRAEDYEQRLAIAGGTDSLMSGLVKAVHQNQNVTKVLGVSLFLDILLSIAFGWVALQADNNTNDIRELVTMQQQSSNERCQYDIAITRRLNEGVQTAIATEKAIIRNTPAELVAASKRIAVLEALILKPPVCTNK